MEEGSQKMTLNAIFPPEVPQYVKTFFEFMREHIVLVGNGFGAELKERRNDIRMLMESIGYDYSLFHIFIDDFENRLMNEYYDSKEKDKSEMS